MVNREVDVLIIGGGLIGAVLMLALANTGLVTLLIDVQPLSSRCDVDFDARSIALSPASVQILKMLQIWHLLEENAEPIESIHVSEQHCFGSARIQGVIDKPLGYVVEMQHLNRVLCQLLEGSQILANTSLTHFDKLHRIATIKNEQGESTIKAKLVVAADGAESSMRDFCNLSAVTKHYEEQALVANIGLARSHHHNAYERFTSFGPLALLPMTMQRCALVWTLPDVKITELTEAPEKEFLGVLQRAFGYRLGRFVKVGRRMKYPLRHVMMPEIIADGVVFIGNAANTLHPVAGQGFNLGLRDVAQLAECVVKYGLNQTMLQQYQASRRADQSFMTRFTDLLIDVFKNPLPGAQLARGAGLMVLDNSYFLKQQLARFTRGFAGVTPDLVCGIPLHQEEI